MNSRTILSAEPAFNGDDVDLSNPCGVRTVLWLFVLFVARKQVVRNRDLLATKNTKRHEKNRSTMIASSDIRDSG